MFDANSSLGPKVYEPKVTYPISGNAAMDSLDATTVTASNNVYTLNLANNRSFYIVTPNTTAKQIVISNKPQGVKNLDILVKLNYINACAITHPTGTTWINGVTPSFITGKKYFILYSSDDGGTTWLASVGGAW